MTDRGTLAIYQKIPNHRVTEDTERAEERSSDETVVAGI